MNDDELDQFLKYKDNLYKFLIESSEELIKSEKGMPDVQLLNLSDRFLKKYRRTSNEEYIKASMLFRKAAHVIHWKMVKLKKTNKSNKFINIV